VKEFEKKKIIKKKMSKKNSLFNQSWQFLFNSFLFASEIKFNFIFPSFLMSG